MTQKYTFDNNEWQKYFNYVYSPIVKKYPVFERENNYLVNRRIDGSDEYEYISILSKEKYSKAKILIECDFHKYGAPLVVFGNDIKEDIGLDGKSHLFYGVHFEIVAWEEGCNVWYLVPDKANKEYPVKPTLLLGEKFTLNADERICVSVEIQAREICVDINGNVFKVFCEYFPEEFCVGFTACEGINKLYSIEIEK